MNNIEIKDKIYEYIRKNGGTSYAEIERLFEKYSFDYIGNIEAFSDKNSKVVFWTGWNKKAFDILAELIRENRIEREPCNFIVYLIDGKILNYPILNKAPKNLKNIYWLPCVFKTCR